MGMDGAMFQGCYEGGDPPIVYFVSGHFTNAIYICF